MAKENYMTNNDVWVFVLFITVMLIAMPALILPDESDYND